MIIVIDGTTASGKGTIARRLARHFGADYLNSGAFYRIVAYEAKKNNLFKSHTDLNDSTNKGLEFVGTEKDLLNIVEKIKPSFDHDGFIFLEGEEISQKILTQEVGKLAAIIAPILSLREALHILQRSYERVDGFLVTEGRDMARVFSHAHHKIYLTAHIDVRSKRRHGDESHRDIQDIKIEIIDRDARDMNREHGRLWGEDEARLSVDTDEHKDKYDIYVDSSEHDGPEKTMEHILEKIMVGRG